MPYIVEYSLVEGKGQTFKAGFERLDEAELFYQTIAYLHKTYYVHSAYPV